MDLPLQLLFRRSITNPRLRRMCDAWDGVVSHSRATSLAATVGGRVPASKRSIRSSMMLSLRSVFILPRVSMAEPGVKRLRSTHDLTIMESLASFC